MSPLKKALPEKNLEIEYYLEFKSAIAIVAEISLSLIIKIRPRPAVNLLRQNYGRPITFFFLVK